MGRNEKEEFFEIESTRRGTADFVGHVFNVPNDWRHVENVPHKSKAAAAAGIRRLLRRRCFLQRLQLRGNG